MVHPHWEVVLFCQPPDEQGEAGHADRNSDSGDVLRLFAIEAADHHSPFSQILDQGRSYEAGAPGDQNFLHGKQSIRPRKSSEIEDQHGRL